MPRKPRLILPGTPHHVTQRGNRRQKVFFTDQDRIFYLKLVSKYFEKFGLELLSYCLMTNHIHLFIVPSDHNGLHLALKAIHRRYAFAKNSERGWCGHFWQERFFSSVVQGENYFWSTIRYIETNPIRAKMVPFATDYRWSSARYHHCGICEESIITKNAKWSAILKQQSDWNAFLGTDNFTEETNIRTILNKGLPYGDEDFIKRLELESGRHLRPRAGGRPKLIQQANNG